MSRLRLCVCVRNKTQFQLKLTEYAKMDLILNSRMKCRVYLCVLTVCAIECHFQLSCKLENRAVEHRQTRPPLPCVYCVGLLIILLRLRAAEIFSVCFFFLVPFCHLLSRLLFPVCRGTVLAFMLHMLLWVIFWCVCVCIESINDERNNKQGNRKAKVKP